MGSFGLGHNAYLGVGEESSYGTIVTRNKFFDILSESLVAEHRRIEAASLNQVGIRKNRIANGSLRYRGTVTMHLTYTDMGRFLKHALGGYTNPALANGTNGSLYDHTFTIADALPTGLTLEIFRDTSNFYTPQGDVNKAFIYRGCKIGSMTITAEIDSFVELSLDFIAASEDRQAKTPAATVMADLDNARNPMVFTQGFLYYGTSGMTVSELTGAVTNGAGVTVESFNVTLDNNLEEDRASLGSRIIREPVRAGGKLAVTGSFVADFNSFERYDEFFNSTTKTLIFVCRNGYLSATNNNYQAMILTLEDVVPTDVPINIADEGPIKQTINFKAYRTLTGATLTYGELGIVLTNAQASSVEVD